MERLYRGQPLEPCGWFSLTITSTSSSIATLIAASASTASFPTSAVVAFGRCEAGTIRYRDDGQAATSLSSGGTVLYADETIEIDMNLRSIQLIKASVATPVLNVSFFGRG